jgi:DNA-directed RNA polymerase specialized sigma24 family protein
MHEFRFFEVAPDPPPADASNCPPAGTPSCESIPSQSSAFSQAILAALGALPERARGHLAQFLMKWNDLPTERRAMLVKALMPELTDEKVAALIGVTRRTVLRYPMYQRLKNRVAYIQAPSRGQAEAPASKDDDDDAE